MSLQSKVSPEQREGGGGGGGGGGGAATTVVRRGGAGKQQTCRKCKKALREDARHGYCGDCAAARKFCHACNRKISHSDQFVSFGGKAVHEECFACSQCDTSLRGRDFKLSGNDALCISCYITVCATCKRKIKSTHKKVDYNSRHYHEDCFTCSLCNKAIGSQNFFAGSRGAICQRCHADKYASRCAVCETAILLDGISFAGQKYHEHCFVCQKCFLVLAGKLFTPHEGKAYCTECYLANFVRRCYRCKKPLIGPNSKNYIAFEERAWHRHCFKCDNCKDSLLKDRFHMDHKRLLCPSCAATKLKLLRHA